MNLPQTMEQEQQRLKQVLDELAGRHAALYKEEQDIRQQLIAIDAYMDALRGKSLTKRPSKSGGTRIKGLKQKILEIVSVSSQGVTRPQLLDKLDAVFPQKQRR